MGRKKPMGRGLYRRAFLLAVLAAALLAAPHGIDAIASLLLTACGEVWLDFDL